MIIGFHSKQLTERGTEVALFDYALGAQQRLGHESRIYVPARSELIYPFVRRRFEAHFEVVLYESPESIACDALYVIKRGRPGRVTDTLPELNHAYQDVHEPHGHRFAAISEWLARTARREIRVLGSHVATVPRLKKVRAVPLIITFPDIREDLREGLGIPDDAVVVGRHGGMTTFAIDFVKDAIRAIVEERDDIWFLLLNTPPFLEHRRVVHLSPVESREDVRRFVNSCDYGLHARRDGEGFGLSVGEFAYVGAPVMTFLRSPLLAHLDLLPGGLLLGYRDYDELLQHLRSLERRIEPVASDIATKYSVETVMTRFDEVFLH